MDNCANAACENRVSKLDNVMIFRNIMVPPILKVICYANFKINGCAIIKVAEIA